MPAPTASIEVQRARSGWTDRRRAYRVVIDGVEAGRLENGEAGVFEVAPGAHEVFLKIDWCRSEKVALDLAAGQAAAIRCEARSPWLALYWVTIGARGYIKLTSVSL